MAGSKQQAAKAHHWMIWFLETADWGEVAFNMCRACLSEERVSSRSTTHACAYKHVDRQDPRIFRGDPLALFKAWSMSTKLSSCCL